MHLILRVVVALCLCCNGVWGSGRSVIKLTQGDFFSIVKENKKIKVPGFPDAHNPSIIDMDEGILLIFRTIPNPLKLWGSEIGAVFLNEKLEVKSKPQLISTRAEGYSKVISQSEDARVFQCDGKLYLIYNDNIEVERPTVSGRRDMFIAELKYQEGVFTLGVPVKYIHQDKYEKYLWQKNWAPFVYKNQMYLSYNLNPHEVLSPNKKSGVCSVLYDSEFHPAWWRYGTIRGGTPSVLVDGRYLGFFHSSSYARSATTGSTPIFHYFMGAYAFESKPPFKITHITPHPIIGEHFYDPSDYPKRVVFPGGFIVRGDMIYVAIGIDDSQLWISSITQK